MAKIIIILKDCANNEIKRIFQNNILYNYIY